MNNWHPKYLLGALVTTLFIGCAPVPPDGEGAESHVSFIPFSSIGQCTIAKAREPVIRVCVDGRISAAGIEKAKLWSKRAVLQWFRALAMIDDRVSQTVEFSCDSPHLTMHMHPGNGTAMAGCGVSNMYEERPYGTYLHEFGHALAGLSDTYAGGAGSCTGGQPRSVMCWGAYGNKDSEGFAVLYDDDVAGIQANYKKIFRDLKSPTVAIDPFATLNPDAPWLNANSGGTQPHDSSTIPTVSIFAALGAESPASADTFDFYVSALASDTGVILCSGDQTKPCADGAGRVAADALRVQGDRRVFKMRVPVALQANAAVSIFSFTSSSGGVTSWSGRQVLRFQTVN